MLYLSMQSFSFVFSLEFKLNRECLQIRAKLVLNRDPLNVASGSESDEQYKRPIHTVSGVKPQPLNSECRKPI